MAEQMECIALRSSPLSLLGVPQRSNTSRFCLRVRLSLDSEWERITPPAASSPPSADCSSLAAALLGLARDPEGRALYGRRSLAFAVENLDLRRRVRDLEQVFREALAGPTAP